MLMLTRYRFKALLLMAILIVVFLGTFGTLLTIPLAFLLVFTLSTVFTNFLGSHWLPTPDSIINAVVEEAKKHKSKVFYDLGCGDARLVTAIAKNTKSKAVGVEIDPLKCLIGKARIKFGKVKNATVLRESFFKTNLSKADIIYCYLPTPTLKRLEPKMKRLKKGTIIITHCIRFPNLKPAKILKKEKIFIYKV